MSMVVLIGLLTACPFAEPIVEPTGFRLSIDPSIVSIQQGGQLALTATVTRTGGFAGDVTLSLIDPPIGVSASPVVVTKAESAGQLILMASQTATAVGPISVSLQGLSAELNKVVPLSLKVTPAPIVNLNTKLDTAPTNAGMVAFQDGLGAWQVLNGANGNYSATVFDSAGRYSLAVVCLSSANIAKNVIIWQYTIAEHPSVQHECDPFGPGVGSGIPVTAIANFIGLNPANKVFIAFDNFGYTLDTNGLSKYTESLASGIHTVLAVEQTQNNIPIRYLFNRDLLIDEIHSLFNLDFNKARTPIATTMVIAGIKAGENTFCENYMDIKNDLLRTGNGGFGIGARFDNAACTFYNLDTIDRLASDLYVNKVNSSTSSSRRSIQYIFKKPIQNSLTLPDEINPTVSVLSNTPSIRLKAIWDSVPNVTSWRLNIKDNNNLLWSLRYSPGWLGFTSLLGYPNTVTMPELSGLPGWQATWGFTTGVPLSWDVRVTTSNRSWAELNRPGIVGTSGYNYETYLQVYDQAEFANSSKNGLITP
jgi:hypothetical protein